MTSAHHYSFFGQNTGMILNSTSKSEPNFFIRCIKKKPNSLWEKPSSGEGKVIKCSLEETVMILEVLNRRLLNWTSYHTYKDNKTSISFSWEDDQAKTLWINIANYSKMLNFAQAEILRLLLTHILNEKIKHATSSTRDKKGNETGNKYIFNEINDNGNSFFNFKENYEKNSFEIPLEESTLQNKNFISKSSTKNDLLKQLSRIEGAIRGETEKALLINFNSGKEIWIPKSTIHCQYTPRKNLTQKFLIDNWILKRNKIIS